MTNKTAKGAVEKPRQSRNRGRPTICTPELTAKLCARLAGGESLRAICSSSEFPDKSTVLLWVVDGKHKEFSDQYRIAREAAGYAHADEALDMRHQVLSGEIGHQEAKVALDALKWGAERMAPKAHSPRMQQEHTSPDGSMTPRVIERRVVDPDGDASASDT